MMNTDMNLRIFLFNILQGRELTSIEIYRAIGNFIPKRRITKQRVYGLLQRLVLYGDVQKIKIDRQERKERDDQSKYCYSLTNKGLKLKRFYLKKLNKK